MKHALVTGAAGAIGGALATAFRHAWPALHLSLSDLDADRLAAVARPLVPNVSVHPCDLSKGGGLEPLVTELEADHGPIDGLVNCAGIMEMRNLSSTPWAVGRRLLEVDLMSPMRLMNLVVPGMVERRSGVVVNVCSMAGVTPIRGCSYYGAAKAGLAMASEIAAVELEEHGVHVVTVYPGPVRSELEQGAREQLPPSLIARLLPTGSPERLARLVIRAIERGRTQVVYPPLYDLFSRLPRLAGRLTRWLSPRPLE